MQNSHSGVRFPPAPPNFMYWFIRKGKRWTVYTKPTPTSIVAVFHTTDRKQMYTPELSGFPHRFLIRDAGVWDAVQYETLDDLIEAELISLL